MAAPQYMEPDTTLYRVRLIGKSGPTTGPNAARNRVNISAWTPENYTFGASAQFEAKLGGGFEQFASAIQSAGSFVSNTPFGLASRLTGGAIQAAGGALSALGSLSKPTFGVALLLQAMTLKTWESSEGVTFSLPLLFNSYLDPATEVTRNLRDLLKLPLPWKGSRVGVNLLSGPGTTFIDLITGQPSQYLNLVIGNHMYIPLVNVESAQIEIDSMYNDEGHPISARVDLQVSTAFLPTREDIDAWFINNPPYASQTADASLFSEADSRAESQVDRATTIFG